ncbi:hypothetical protein J8273_5874 [Carpediemonas membranifera]|uniref:Uncharacterized protein n=1 Tax=Carpediemonas membranifera TaxID=201153 RepID=A0A8J6AUE5_9EUKA|nr:hypothetical protein J8273_5874 [Carpediemonas membranifera]|eukprot:KAG9392735.1 hypothetical protein J8273_5874 [Carpediemonas membranifera]
MSQKTSVSGTFEAASLNTDSKSLSSAEDTDRQAKRVRRAAKRLVSGSEKHTESRNKRISESYALHDSNQFASFKLVRVKVHGNGVKTLHHDALVKQDARRHKTDELLTQEAPESPRAKREVLSFKTPVVRLTRRADKSAPGILKTPLTLNPGLTPGPDSKRGPSKSVRKPKSRPSRRKLFPLGRALPASEE